HLAELLQHPIVQMPKSVRCTLKLTHPRLYLSIAAVFAHHSRNGSRKLVMLGTCKLIFLAERSRDVPLLTGNRIAQIPHPLAKLDDSQMVLSNKTFYLVCTSGNI